MSAPKPGPGLFEIAANPDPDSSPPFLIRLPLPDGGARAQSPGHLAAHREGLLPPRRGLARAVRDPRTDRRALLPAAGGRDRPGARAAAREPLPARVHPHPRRPRSDLLAVGADDPPSPPRDPCPPPPRRRPRRADDPGRHPRALPLPVRPPTSPAPSAKRSRSATTASPSTTSSSRSWNARASPTSPTG